MVGVRGIFVILGVILLVVSVPMLIYHSNAIAQYNISLGQLGRLFSPSEQQNYQNMQTMQMISAIFVLGGIVSTSYGLVAKHQINQSNAIR